MIDPYDDDPEPLGTALLLAKLNAVQADLTAAIKRAEPLDAWSTVPPAARAMVVELLEQKADPGGLGTDEENAAFRAAAAVLRALG